MARHLAPFAWRQRMAAIVRRRSFGAVLPLGRHASISGSSLIQCASASMAPPHPGGAKCYPGEEVQGRTGPSSVPEEATKTDSRLAVRLVSRPQLLSTRQRLEIGVSC